MGITRVAFAAIIASSGLARADVDWARGQVTARGIGVANRAAPNPATARGPARRMAEDAARKQLLAQLPALPLAAGGTLKDKLGDARVKARIDRAVAAALVVSADPETDGSWNVVMAVPIEAVRQALGTPRMLGEGKDDGPAVVIIEGAVKPAVGYRIGAIAAPALFVEAAPAWAKEAPRARLKRVTKDTLELDKPIGGESTLFVVVGK